MSIYKIFLLLSLILLITCEEATKTEEPKVEVGKAGNETNSNETKEEKKEPDFKNPGPFNMTYDDMDNMIACSFMVQETVRKDRKKYEEIAKKIGLNTTNKIVEKAGTDMFEKCLGLINVNISNRYFRNLSYINEFQWEKEYEKYIKIDYNYNNETDLNYSMPQNILLYKFQKVNELFRQKVADDHRRVDDSNRKIRIGSLDLENIPSFIKILIFLGIFGLLFGGVFYLLKTLGKKEEKNKKKKVKTK